MPLREYQKRDYASLQRAFKRGLKRVVLGAPTGSGKTTVAAEMIRNAIAKGRRPIFIADRNTLIDQASERFDQEGIEHGIIQANHWRNRPSAPLQVCSAQTLMRRRWPDTDLIIIDECHTTYKKINEKILRWDNIPVVGLSATPWARGMGLVYQELITGPTISELIDQKWLVPFECYGPGKPDLSKVRTTAGEFNQKDLAEVSNKTKLVADIVETWLKRGEDRQTICFAVNIPHSQHIAAQFIEFGIPAAHIDTYTPPEVRREILNDFKEGRIKVISSVDILSKGFDQPEASCLIMAQATKSLMRFIQQFGRVLRIAPGKKDAIILDHAGNIEDRFGFPTDPLPRKLDMGQRRDVKNKKRERRPTVCKNDECKYQKPPGVHECPKCGFAPLRQNKIEEAEGDLKKIKKATMAEKQVWYSMFLYYADSKGYKRGWAANAYRKKFGVWPRNLSEHLLEPNGEVRAYIKHLAIAYAKRKDKNDSSGERRPQAQITQVDA